MVLQIVLWLALCDLHHGSSFTCFQTIGILIGKFSILVVSHITGAILEHQSHRLHKLGKNILGYCKQW